MIWWKFLLLGAAVLANYIITSVVWTWNNRAVAKLNLRESVITDGLIIGLQWFNLGAVLLVSLWLIPFTVVGSMTGCYYTIRRLKQRRDASGEVCTVCGLEPTDHELHAQWHAAQETHNAA